MVSYIFFCWEVGKKPKIVIKKLRLAKNLSGQNSIGWICLRLSASLEAWAVTFGKRYRALHSSPVWTIFWRKWCHRCINWLIMIRYWSLGRANFPFLMSPPCWLLGRSPSPLSIFLSPSASHAITKLASSQNAVQRF